jgi:DNA topoisomerase IA
MSTEKDAKAFLESCKGADYKVTDIQVKPAKRTPAAPFTTSTLQQEASRKMGYSVSKTMLLAQKLYESGKITYMRTDSINLSDTALERYPRTRLPAPTASNTTNPGNSRTRTITRRKRTKPSGLLT